MSAGAVQTPSHSQVRVQQADFDVAAEIAAMRAGKPAIGAVASFIGICRDMNEGDSVSTMTLEHYPGMTERALEEIDAEAHRRWPLDATLVIHRHGRLEPGEDIVLVIAASAHREAAFEACHFLIDWLKTKAPFWKLEENDQGASWVAAKDSDDDAAQRWDT